MKKKIKSMQYKDTLLQKCKKHGGPFTDIYELKEYVKCTDKKLMRSSLRQEIGFSKLLHPADAKERPHLYKMNYLTIEKLIENLSILLDNDITTTKGQ